ncbi:hypothetical protein AKJ37_07645 [candidate division MSBL1 archaeon SCGC-AAA259I09]|uniref:Flavin prenyltransferase UbiX n=4 Tax=candidate division MSBL1 TaxID=215777 RepID=A0A133UX82_9EURY|nr:hypothetical protein AKJ62_04845 [candidate division MSBL1 archaeon SCGC-AAA259D14]KXA94397.1 hypothetical protein AKJ37_07645 [candidate division MSBL1 archaeon SCGC-AAA259I09]KXA97390.1 hypothetical protein AKJ39_03355 [candidate division MSBL1 archaeon SCGC-AAA259J03]KXA98789.1 hypothetical protein AKJ41_06330 [candidate division MSBL1 archaeon SCGC-AAA259O05]
MNDKKRVILGMTGATGQIIGIEILKILSDLERVETHLIISRVAGEIIHYESELKISEVKEKADEIYNNKEVGAPPASGSFKRAGMIVAPCSMKTLSALANAYSNNLIVRAGDVTLKERRKLITIPREKPLNSIHLKNMLKLSNAGGIIMPPVPSFYFKPEKVTDVVKEIALKAIDLLDIINRPLRTEWKGFEKTENSCP